jgi:hypothetical protein
LDAEPPLGKVAARDGVEQITLMAFAILADDRCRLVVVRQAIPCMVLKWNFTQERSFRALMRL